MNVTLNDPETSPPIIWVLEPDELTRSAYRECLSANYEVVELTSLNSLSQRIEQDATPSLLISDINLEDGNIVEQCASLNIEFPFILSSSDDSRSLIEQSFALGCSDFLTKPVNCNELLVKVARAIQTKSDTTNEINTDQARLRVYDSDRFEQLTPKEMQIVTLLKSGPHSRIDIMNNIWEDTNVSRKAFDVHLFHLRRKLAKLSITILLNKDGRYSIHKQPDVK